MMRIATAIVLLLVASSAWAQKCTTAEAQAAESSVDSLASWQSIYASYRQYGHCDDGSIAEGFTDKIVHLLATRWDSLSQAQQLIASDPKFRVFVLRHINGSALTTELNRVATSARNQCPRSAALLCKQIAGAASER